MNSQPVRLRFAPSPTGGLHLGGMRTVLFNYLFAKQNKGKFILRIEDTDQSRYVAGAEEYIFQCLEWCGLMPDESVMNPGEYGPYRQSERKAIYAQYAEQLVKQGDAYYAFDTAEELDKMRQKSINGFSAQYDHRTRSEMNNSLNMSSDDLMNKLNSGHPYVIRLKVPAEGEVEFHDMIRGRMAMDLSAVDDKVLLKADGMPTYHLAVVVDDYLMKISHAFRGEEWLPSAPIHLLLWEKLGWKEHMPQWAHLPLILKPDGNGKLSKRDGERLGFPVFAMNWHDPNTDQTREGFKERGFLPQAFINMLAMLGWHPGSEQELFSIEELIEVFDMSRVQKGGAKFDFEKAKWFNQQYIQNMPIAQLAKEIKPFIPIAHHDHIQESKLEQLLTLVKDRLVLLTDFWPQAHYFFQSPENIDKAAIEKSWNEDVANFFLAYQKDLENNNIGTPQELEAHFTDLATNRGLKKGALMLPLRIMLVGGKFGPGVFDILHFIGQAEASKRIQTTLKQF